MLGVGGGLLGACSPGATVGPLDGGVSADAGDDASGGEDGGSSGGSSIPCSVYEAIAVELALPPTAVRLNEDGVQHIACFSGTLQYDGYFQEERLDYFGASAPATRSELRVLAPPQGGYPAVVTATMSMQLSFKAPEGMHFGPGTYRLDLSRADGDCTIDLRGTERNATQGLYAASSNADEAERSRFVWHVACGNGLPPALKVELGVTWPLAP